MDVFKLLGTVAINTDGAKTALDGVTEKGEKTGSKLTEAFARIENAFGKIFLNDKSDDVKKSFDDLTSTTDKQKEKLEALKKEYRNLYIQHGQNSSEAKNVASKIQALSAEIDKNEAEMKEASKAADSYDKTIKEVGETAEKSEGKLSKAFAKIGKAAVAVGKTVAVGMAAAGTAVAGLVTASVKSYADYEQLVGGVETLFKDSSAKVMQYANEAYKTAGMSANAYMETVTSFSASLLQSLGGDTEAATEYANKAIIDMSDNANKMGTDIGMIQNAYNGFAKQNYTMLDNLKLGYGGTQEEMKRLLADASELAGVEFDISSYSDVIEAIHVIQTNMGITGTTAKEASSTISGSISTMKGAWENLTVAMAGGGDVSERINALVDSIGSVADNVLPVVETALGGAVMLIEQLAPKLIGMLPGLVTTLLPAILDATIGLFNGLVAAFPELVNALMAVLPSLIDGIKTLCYLLIDSLPEIIPILIEAGILITLAIVEALPEICAALIEAIPAIVMSIASGFLEAAPEMYESFTRIWNNIKERAVGMSDRIRESVRENFEKLKTNCADELTFLKTKATEIFENIKSAISEKIEVARDKVKSAIDKIKGFFDFEFKWPKIPLPHFSVQPSGWEIGDLLKGSMPSLGIEWYAKAMENPMIMDDPTIFGYNSETGQFMGGGEAGSEVVTGTNTLMEMIASAVASQNEAVVYYLKKLIEMLAMYFPEVLNSMGHDVVLDSGALVGSLAAPLNQELGRLASRKDRGR